MDALPTNRLFVIVPTYARSLGVVTRCLDSVRRAIPAGTLARRVVVDQNPVPLALPADVVALRAEPGYPGPRRHLGAEYVLKEAAPSDVLLFLDDDIELTDWSRWPELLDPSHPEGVLAREDTGCVQVSTRRWQSTAPISLGDTAGGILIRAETYRRIGGFGEDYLDDLELFTRALLAGKRNWRTGLVRSLHHYGEGGLKSYLAVNRRGRAHLSRSRLAQRYPGAVVPDPLRRLGFRYVAEQPRPPRLMRQTVR